VLKEVTRQGSLGALATLAAVLSLAPAVVAGDQALFAAKVRSLVGKYEASSKAVCGLQVVDLRNDRCLVRIRDDRQFVPASNQKILTSAFALARLGPDYQFTTNVCRLGDDLVVFGGGDPTLGDPVVAARKQVGIYCELDRWAAEVRAKLGRTVQGDLLMCGGYGLARYRHEDWPDAQHSRWYCAPVAGLNFHNNCFEVSFTVTGMGVQASVSPISRYITVLSKVKKGKRHLWSLRSNGDDSKIELTGTVSKSTATPLPVAANNPPMLLGWVFADRLEKAGVALAGRVRSVKRSELNVGQAKLLARTVTPLADVLRRANKVSLNMAAECLFLRAGDGSWQGSAQKMKTTLTAEYGLADGDLVVRDGGGLSRQNRVTPRAVCKTLSVLALQPAAEVFLKSLPRSGTDGSLKKRLTRRPYAGRILAKTGYVNGASCLSGYVLDADYRVTLVFSILVGKVKLGKAWVAKNLQDSICRELVDFVDGGGK